jgi:DNA-binding PadR family transcriptional regulator
MPKSSSYVSALSPEYALLGLLAQQPAHGYELHQRLAADLGYIWHISLSQTYNILNRLESQGLISGALQEQAKLPARRQFQITQTGRQRFEDWLHTPSGYSVRAIRVEFCTRLYFASAQSPELAERLIEDQERELRLGLERLQRTLPEIPSQQAFNRLGLELRIRQLESILEWLESCRRAILPGGEKGSILQEDHAG